MKISLGLVDSVKVELIVCYFYTGCAKSSCFVWWVYETSTSCDYTTSTVSVNVTWCRDRTGLGWVHGG